MLHTYAVNAEGVGTGEDLKGPKEIGIDFRSYLCTNCKREFYGADSFDEARAHLGKMNESLYPDEFL